MQTIRDILGSQDLDIRIPLGENSLTLDGLSITPEGFIDLEEMEIECESAVKVSHDENGEPVGLAIMMTRGLFSRATHVKFKAKFHRHGTIEAVEILRDASNEVLRRELERTGIPVKRN